MDVGQFPDQGIQNLFEGVDTAELLLLAKESRSCRSKLLLLPACGQPRGALTGARLRGYVSQVCGPRRASYWLRRAFSGFNTSQPSANERLHHCVVTSSIGHEYFGRSSANRGFTTGRLLTKTERVRAGRLAVRLARRSGAQAGPHRLPFFWEPRFGPRSRSGHRAGDWGRLRGRE